MPTGAGLSSVIAYCIALRAIVVESLTSLYYMQLLGTFDHVPIWSLT
jgi:hypothetical protein